MPNELLKYFEKRISADKIKLVKSKGFVTISRQTGCNGNSVAAKLVKKLSNQTKWKYINKEILEHSAQKLNLRNSKLNHMFDAESLSHANEIISAFSNRYYKSDRKLKNTITEVIKHYAMEGNIVIVGRAAVGITSEMSGGLHIRLTAPLEWRINSLKKRKGFEGVDVKKFITDHDKKKVNIIKRFCDVEFNEIPFDLTINCAHFNQDQIVEFIVKAMKLKGIN